MTLDQLIEQPQLDISHHLRTNLALPMNDRISFEDHQSEITHANLYEFAKTVLDEVHTELKITPPEPEEQMGKEEATVEEELVMV